MNEYIYLCKKDWYTFIFGNKGGDNLQSFCHCVKAKIIRGTNTNTTKGLLCFEAQHDVIKVKVINFFGSWCSLIVHVNTQQCWTGIREKIQIMIESGCWLTPHLWKHTCLWCPGFILLMHTHKHAQNHTLIHTHSDWAQLMGQDSQTHTATVQHSFSKAFFKISLSCI